MITKGDRHAVSIKLEEAVNCMSRIGIRGADPDKELADARRLTKEASKILNQKK